VHSRACSDTLVDVAAVNEYIIAVFASGRKINTTWNRAAVHRPLILRTEGRPSTAFILLWTFFKGRVLILQIC